MLAHGFNTAGSARSAAAREAGMQQTTSAAGFHPPGSTAQAAGGCPRGSYHEMTGACVGLCSSPDQSLAGSGRMSQPVRDALNRSFLTLSGRVIHTCIYIYIYIYIYICLCVYIYIYIYSFMCR